MKKVLFLVLAIFNMILIRNAYCESGIDGGMNQDDANVAVTHYSEKINALDPKKIESISEAVDLYIQYFANSNEKARDLGFVCFCDYYQSVIEKQNEIIESNSNDDYRRIQLIDQTTFDGFAGLMQEQYRKYKKDPFLVQLYNNGLDIYLNMGFIIVDQRPGYLKEVFSKYVSKSINDYLRIRIKDFKQCNQIDGMLLISFSDLAKRIINWENYIAQYPDSVLIKQAKGYRDHYLGALMLGLPNTRVYDPENDYIDRKVLKIYEKYAIKNDKRYSGIIIQKYLDLIKKNEYKSNPNVDSFMKENNIPIPLVDGLER